MPALRERLEDVPILVEELLKPLAKEMGRPTPVVSAVALKKLAAYPWPGNVRELRNVLERAMLMQSGRELRSEDLVLEAGAVVPAAAQALMPSEEWDVRPLDDVTAEYIAAAVKAMNGNVRKAARPLKISPSTLYARLRTEK
jgi:DNA-binding NtrC family response regulator